MRRVKSESFFVPCFFYLTVTNRDKNADMSRLQAGDSPEAREYAIVDDALVEVDDDLGPEEKG